MNAYYINLDRRPDRKKQVEVELTRIGVQAVRIPATDGKLWDGIGWKKQGRAREAYWKGSAGCWFSHMHALETAIATGSFPCLIVEDDVVFTDDLPTEWPYPMTLLGGNYVEGKGTYLAHSICYTSQAAAQHFLDALQKCKDTVDSVSVRLQKHEPSFCGVLQKHIAHQRVDYSDIGEQVMKRGTTEK